MGREMGGKLLGGSMGMDGDTVELLLDRDHRYQYVPQRGFGLIKASRMVTATVPMLEHALWCQGKGDNEVNPLGSKMFPLEM